MHKWMDARIDRQTGRKDRQTDRHTKQSVVMIGYLNLYDTGTIIKF